MHPLACLFRLFQPAQPARARRILTLILNIDADSYASDYVSEDEALKPTDSPQLSPGPDSCTSSEDESPHHQILPVHLQDRVHQHLP